MCGLSSPAIPYASNGNVCYIAPREYWEERTMRSLWKCLLAALFSGASLAAADPVVFHSETFGDQTTVTMALTSRSALLQQEYDYGVTINLVATDQSGLGPVEAHREFMTAAQA